MDNNQNARRGLLAFDGKNVQPLRSLAASTEPTDAELRRFLRLARDRDSRVALGATWIVKNLAERREQAIPRDIAATLVARLPVVEHSMSRLHLLQTLPMCTLGAASLRFLRDFLPELLQREQHRLTRAWIFNGFAEIARCDPDYRNIAVGLLSEAYQVERAAVRARIRNALGGL